MNDTAATRRPGKQAATVAEQTRQSIVAAALELFAQHGYEAVGLRDIAERAGTTHGLIRHHFGSKDGVWRAVVDAADTAYAGALQPLVLDATQTSDTQLAAAFAALVRGFVQVSADHPAIVQLLLREGVSASARLAYILAHLAPLRDPLQEIVPRLHRQGRLCTFDADTLFLFLLTAGATPFALHGLTDGVLGAAGHGPEAPLHLAERLTALLLGDAEAAGGPALEAGKRE